MNDSSNTLTENLAKLLLAQAGVLRANEDLTPQPKLPASVGDILRSEKFWKTHFNNSDEKWNNSNQKISTKP